jgi:hypothetical protein
MPMGTCAPWPVGTNRQGRKSLPDYRANLPGDLPVTTFG